MAKGFHVATKYINVLLWLALALTLASLQIWDCRHRHEQFREEQELIEKAKSMLRNEDQYRREVERAKELLERRERQEAIVKLERAIAHAREQGLIPVKHSNQPFFPSEGEILLMKLYHEDGTEGHVLKHRMAFQRYFESAYPDFRMGYFDLERQWRELRKRSSCPSNTEE